MFSSSRSCGSGKIFNRFGGGAESTILPSYIGEVISKLKKIPDYQNLTKDEFSLKASELTDSDKIWSIYFSAVVLDPVRESIKRKIEGETIASKSTKKIPVRLRLESAQDLTQLVKNPLTSLLLKNLGPYQASIIVCNEVLLHWTVSSVIIPTGVPIPPPVSIAKPPGKSGTTSQVHQEDEVATVEDEIEIEFEHSASLKEHLDKLIGVIVRYNKNYIYHPISRNGQKFLSDALQALNYPVSPQLEKQKLIEYYSELKKKINKPIFESHAQLDEYVSQCLQSHGIKPLEMEHLIGQYFKFHVSSLSISNKPKRWVCEERGCQLSQLEQRIELKDTIAYRIFIREQT